MNFWECCKRSMKLSLFTIFFAFFVCSISFSAGYQEEKLFDGDFYSAEDLREKIENHKKEIRVLKKQIKALETDIDWMVLKINQIEDTGRSASPELKASISRKEKKIGTLLKTKQRLEYLVKYYSEMKSSDKEKTLEEIVRNKTYNYQVKQVEAIPEKTKPNSQSTTPKAAGQKKLPVTTSIGEIDLDKYDGVSKSELQNAISKAGLGDWVQVVGTGTCLRVETTLPILFSTGSAEVAKEYKSFFRKLAEFLKPYDVKVLVNGYADKMPINNKKYPSNFELGATRAANIVHQLVDYGLKPSIFRIESTGKYRFASKGMSKQKSLERKAEVIVIFSG